MEGEVGSGGEGVQAAQAVKGARGEFFRVPVVMRVR